MTLSGLVAAFVSSVALAQEPPQIGSGPEAAVLETGPVSAAPRVEPALLYSRLGALQLHMNIVLGVEPVDNAHAVAFGTSAELLYHCRIGVFAGLMSSKGNAVLATVDPSGNVRQAPGDRISIPFGLAFHPLGYMGMRAGSGARGWAQRLAAGLGLELGPTIEHIRTSGSAKTVGGLHAGLAIDIPLWGGPVEGGVMLRVAGRLVVAPSVTLESGSVYMPAASGQFYGGVTWAL
ncbi:MAG: hypothetical protein ABI321_23440 [Polyangia bacterium]